MSKHTFEDFLMEKHADQYVGTKDCMIDDFSDWLEGLDFEEWFSFADKFQKQINAELLKACKKALEFFVQLDIQQKTISGLGLQLNEAIEKATGNNDA